MIAVICAMQEELDALLERMEDDEICKGSSLFYHGIILESQYHHGKIQDHEVIATRCGVGMVYAAIATVNLINEFHPQLIINSGVAGSLDKDTHVNDLVVADRIANWRIEVPNWERSVSSIHCSYPCDNRVLEIVKNLKQDHIRIGPIVSSDEFIRFKKQTGIIQRYFPEALAGEMEGAAIANVCYAYQIPCSIIRSISDETLVNGDYKNFDFNLSEACDRAAELCKEIIMRY